MRWFKALLIVFMESSDRALDSFPSSSSTSCGPRQMDVIEVMMIRWEISILVWVGPSYLWSFNSDRFVSFRVVVMNRWIAIQSPPRFSGEYPHRSLGRGRLPFGRFWHCEIRCLRFEGRAESWGGALRVVVDHGLPLAVAVAVAVAVTAAAVVVDAALLLEAWCRCGGARRICRCIVTMFWVLLCRSTLAFRQYFRP